MRKRLFYGYVVVAIAFTVLMIVVGMDHSFGVFMKPIAADTGWTRAEISAASSLSLVLMGVLGIAMGGLTDRFGPRVVSTSCAIVMGIGCLLMSRVDSLWQLYLVYGVLVTAGYSMYVPMMSTVSRWFYRNRSLMTGITTCGIGVGGLALPLIANSLIEGFGWRTTFVILGSVYVVVLVTVVQFLRRDPDPAEMAEIQKTDNKERPHLSLPSKSYTLKQAVRTREYWMVAAVFLIFGACLQTVVKHITPHGTDLGLSAAVGAGLVGVVSVTSNIGKLVLGFLGDRIGYYRALAMALVVIAATFVFLLFARDTFTLYVFATLFGIAYGGCITQFSPLTAHLFGLASFGLIFGTANLALSAGSAIGSLMAGYIFDQTGSYQLAFVTLAIAGVAAVIITMLIGRTQSRPVEPRP